MLSFNLIQTIKDQNRKDVNFNHLSAVAEGIAALGWVAVSPTPAPYIKEMSDSAQFYTNKVLIAYKDKDASHCEWAKAWIAFLGELQTFVRKHHTTGLVWNARGETIEAGIRGPPPPPPPGFFDNNTNGGSSMIADGQKGDDSRAALFQALNKGTDITKGLKKVSSDQMTHKNPELRQSAVVPSKSGTSTVASAKKVAPKLPPILELQGKKWIVENYSGDQTLKIDDTSMSQSVNVYNCNDSLLVVKGKVNSIIINRCKKFAIVFEDIVSVVEFIDSQRVKAQVCVVIALRLFDCLIVCHQQANGKTPTITIDKTDGIEIYLGNESLACEIVSSKSSEININVLDKNGEFVSCPCCCQCFLTHVSHFAQVEHPIPEQLKTIWNGKAFETVALDKM